MPLNNAAGQRPLLCQEVPAHNAGLKSAVRVPANRQKHLPKENPFEVRNRQRFP